MLATAVTPDWTSTRYFALKGERRDPITGDWKGDLTCHPATAHYAAVLRTTSDDRQVVIWADPCADTTVCRCEARKPLVSLMCMWESRGERFGRTAHLDGTTCEAALNGEAHARPRCPECGTYDSLTTSMEAYGDSTTCTTPTCSYSRWYSIGD